MNKAMGFSRKVTFPAGLCGMLALLVVIELCIDRNAVDHTGWGVWAWRVSGQAAYEDARGAEILCMGDSLVKLGVLPPVLADRLDQRVYNLSICAAQAPASYFLLRRALASGARPRKIIVDFKPGMLAGAPREFARTWPEFLTLAECLELSWHSKDRWFFAATSLAIIFPSIRARLELRENVLRSLDGIASPLRPITLQYWQNWTVNQGGQPTARNPAYRGKISAEHHKKLLSHVFWCNRVNRLYINRFLKLARKNGVTVYWLLPPLSPAAQGERERTGAERRHEEFVRSFLEHHPNLVIVDGRHSRYDTSVFIDPVHLDRVGASALSLDLAEVLASDQSPARRWLELPAFRERPVAVALPEIVDANVALQALMEQKRR